VRGFMVKVLVVEDDLMIADAAEEVLVRAGFIVCGIARTVGTAVTLAVTHQPDLLFIDLSLAEGGLGSQIPSRLRNYARCGILYATGSVAKITLNDQDGDACLAKPYRSADLLRSFELVAEIVATGTASPPFPHGFRVLSAPIEARRVYFHG
jgi:DNA-binding response OmpR family regulator